MTDPAVWAVVPAAGAPRTIPLVLEVLPFSALGPKGRPLVSRFRVQPPALLLAVDQGEEAS